MPDSTHITHHYDRNGTITAAGTDEDLDFNDESQLAAAQQVALRQLEKERDLLLKDPKEYFKMHCNFFAADPDHASGWMIAHMNDAGEVNILDKKGDQMLPVHVALKNPNMALYEKVPFEADAHKDVYLPNGYFWLSVEEALGTTPVFLVGTGDLGPLVNIGTYLKMADRWDVDEMYEEPGLFAETVLDALKQAENPSHSHIIEDVYTRGFQFDTAELKAFMEAHRSDLVDDVDWPASPAP
ncbi:hypothetical protein [Sulfitobacter sp. R18_1]|uniref:hypothetical protein n=1 Tax=Sulfitobacter sp. R18_1 TaxID=2821104 RepID=UPI001AD9FC4F|nr:hypothetical protein [Sulfitobacter sp. R18_1]MBO9428192.1 hypothetical protein [Sulfitobacter sp. R18_1]